MKNQTHPETKKIHHKIFVHMKTKISTQFKGNRFQTTQKALAVRNKLEKKPSLLFVHDQKKKQDEYNQQRFTLK